MMHISCLKLLSDILYFLPKSKHDLLKPAQLCEDLFKFILQNNLTSDIIRESVFCLCNLTVFDTPKILKACQKGYFNAINLVLLKSHSFIRGMLISALWVIFSRARNEGYVLERQLAKEYMKIDGVNVIEKIENTKYKNLKERVFLV